MGAEGIEAIGDAVTGGMIGRAVEPETGERHEAHEGGLCLNCGAELTGPYCRQCGQAAHVHRSLSAFWHDLAHGVLHFEGKIWRTLPLLAWRPGELTRRYIAGERARFVSPMAFFLFSVFLMFAIFNAVGGPIGGSDLRARGKQASDLQHQESTLAKEIRTLDAQKAALAPGSAAAARVEANLVDRRRALSAVRLLQLKSSDVTADDIVQVDSGDNLGSFDHAYRKAKENPSLLIYKLQSNAYKFSWLLIPMSVPFVWLLFLHRSRYRRYKAYDHTVFVTYSLAFMTLLVVALSLVHAIGLPSGWSIFALAAVPPIHMFRQLRGAYGLSRPSALWRTALLAFFAALALSIFLLLMTALGVMH
ncbi:MAG: hypothetical protein JWO25_1007 [Alphaproteobacteria bacterium]|nr:hypothetical protein [Alphaproteobacteria bacterium]